MTKTQTEAGQDKASHTALPWEVRAERDGRTTIYYVKTGDCIIYLTRGFGQTDEAARNTMKRVCLSVNSHDALVMACKGAIAALSQKAVFPADIEAAKKWLGDAVAKAEGRAE